MVHRFSRPVPVLSMITNKVLIKSSLKSRTHQHRIRQWYPEVMDPLALQRYDNAVAQTRAPLQNCFGFMEGSARPIAQGLTPISELFVTSLGRSIRSNFNLFPFYFLVS